MTFSEISVGDAVHQIMASPAPILFPDTCALVDLIRTPYRTKTSVEAKNILKAASRLVSHSQIAPPNLWIVIPPPIHNEWNEHSYKTISKVRQHWSKLDSTIEIAHAVADAVNVTLPSAIIYSNQDIENALLNLSKDFLSNAIFLAQDSECLNRAWARLANKEAPAQKGGEMKDCMIIEHCIELCTRLRNAGFTQHCVFNSSNTKDFCKSGSTTEPDVPLDVQFDLINLSLTTNWQWTRAELNV